MRTILVVLFLYLGGILFAQNNIAYLRSTVGSPWNTTTNESIMDDVFGAGNWDDLRFETVDVTNLLSTRSLLFFDGSDDGANELESFLANNLSAIESWVSSGGNLFLNSGPNEGNGMNFGFGGTSLVYPGVNASTVTLADASHPIFNGPHLPVGTTWSGNSFSHAIVSGTNLDTLLVNSSNTSQVPLALKQWGAGRVIFGGMTTTNFHSPQPQAANLRKNILEYLKFNPVALDAGIASIDSPMIFCPGMHNIVVSLGNFGLDTIFDVTINWEFNGLPETPIDYSIPLDIIGSGNNIVQLVLGNKNFVIGQNYTIKAWTSDPNGIVDTVNFNDTVSVVISPAISGTFTIGGTSPDYNTFTDAVNAINTFGVCGPVTFNVRNGTYNEQITLQEIAGADSLNQITFQSESGDSSQVTLTFSSISSASNYTLRLNGTDWVSFKNLTIEASGLSYGRAIDFTQSANHNTFENNVLRSPLVSSTSSNYAIVYNISTTLKEYNVFVNNAFQNGSYGIYFEGNFNDGNYVSGTKINNNNFTHQYRWAIYLYYQNNPEVSNNVITTNSLYTAYRGIYFTRTYFGATITGNHITGLVGDIGMYLDEVYGTVSEQSVIANNFVHIGGSNTVYGIYSDFGSFQNILYNTVHLTNSNISSRAYFDAGGSNKILLNNIFSNSGGGYSIYINSISSIVNSDYNDFYSTGDNLGYWSGNIVDLSAWKIATSYDFNSFSDDPLFILEDNYAISNASLNNQAIASPLISIDIQNEMRNDTTPDIGADEWTPPALDAALTGFSEPVSPFAQGTRPVTVILKNNGLDSLNSADIDWEVNAASQTQYQWTGSLASGDTTHVQIGNFSFNLGQPYQLKCWVSNPNNSTDPVSSNDTTELNNLYVALGGTYTIGGTTPDFITFNDAVNAMEQGGVVDTVVFLVRNGIYNEQLSIEEASGVGESNPVTFISESGDSTQVTLTYNANSTNNYTVRFNGIDWITFSKITVEATHPTYARVIELTSGSNYVTLNNNNIKGVAITSTSTNQAVIYSTSSFVNEYFNCLNNRIDDGSYGIYFAANTSHVSGTEISGNKFTNQYTYGLFLDEHNAPVINHNEVSSNSTYTSFYGIYNNDSNLGGEIQGNKVSFMNSGSGIRIQDMFGDINNQSWIVNNFIEIGTGLNNNIVYGIASFNGNYHNIDYNSVHVKNSNPASSPLYNSGGSLKQLFNNIFANSGGGYAIHNVSVSAFAQSDYNDLYTSGGTLINWGNVLWGTLTEWQSGGNFTEVHSISANPYFTASSFAVAQSALNGAALPIAGLNTDIEGEARDTLMPDIGADEFVLPPLDAGINAIIPPNTPFPVGNHLVEVALVNHGVDTLQGVQINWTINGLNQPVVNWTGTLLSADTAIVELDSVGFPLGQSIDITAWTSNPNGFADLFMANDTATVTNLYGGLSGIYTIGGVSPDFLDFSSALTNLNIGGVVGPVTFNVRNGTYNEQFELNEIPGVDSSQQIIFKSESGDSSLVTLTFNANSSNNYIIKLNGADWITISGMTLEATNTSYARVIELTNGSNHISILNNILKGVSTFSTSANQAVFYSPANQINEHIKLINNRILEGSYGIYYTANGNHVSGTEVRNNELLNQYTYAIYLDEHNAPVINENEITSNSTYSSFHGIYNNDSNLGGEIQKNNIYGIGSGTGIRAADMYGSIDDEGLIANNFVQVGGTNISYGLYLDYGSYLKTYHNTIHLTNTNISSYSFYTRWGSTKEILNNIFANSGGGNTYYNNSSTAITQSNFNDLYTTGLNIGFYINTTYTDLASWQAGANQDTNSISADPLFLSDTNLHVLNVILDKKATPVPEVTDDIDGDFRDPAKPDIGADEFSTAQDDAGIVAISSPDIPFAADIQPVRVSLLNNGLDTLESVTINWEVNGIPQPAFSWNGALLSGQTEDSISLGNFTFEIDTAYSIQAWTADPNGNADPENFNDTTRVDDLYAALSGIYTLGGTSPDFQDFQHAVTSLSNGGVIGPVIFNVRSGIYDEQISIPQVIGADSTNTITFQSEVLDSTQVVLSSALGTNIDNYVLKLDGTDWITFQHMTLQSNQPTYSRVVYILNDANHLQFNHCALIGNTINSTSTNYIIVYSDNSNDDQISFTNNLFSEGSYGLYLSGTNTTTSETGTTIKHNSFNGQYYRSIFLQYQDAPNISNNTFTSDVVYCCSYFGIYSDNSKNDLIFTNNYFFNLPSGYGIYMNNNDGIVGKRGLIANNFIHIGLGANTSNYGIYSTSCAYQDIYHNTIHINSSSTSSRALFLNSNFINVKNNIFACSDKGYTYYVNSGGNIISNYNDLYGQDVNLGYWFGTNTPTLLDWQNTTSQDGNSVSIDPIFVSDYDLHVSEVDLNNTGTPIPIVTIDFDGEVRDPVMPDIGADEFTPMTTNDAEVVEFLSPNANTPFAPGIQPVNIAIKNNGIDTLLSTTIQWEGNGLGQVPYPWSGFLLPGQRDTITIGSFNFTIGFGTSLLAFTQNPNNKPDNNTNNDTSAVFDLHPALNGIYTIGGSLPDFNSFSSASNALNKGGILGPVLFKVRNGIYQEQFILNEINGSNSGNTVSFQAENGDSSLVSLEHSSGSGNQYLVRLNGADYVTFKKLTFKALSTYSRIFELTNGANNNTIQNCHLIDVNNGNDQLILSNGSFLNNNTLIENNRFENGGYGVYLFGQNTSQLESGTQILNNVFENQYYYGVHMQYQNAPKIEYNRVFTSRDRSDFNAIYLRYCDNDFTIKNNNISGGFGFGLNLNRCDGTLSKRATIVNNFIQVGGTNTAYGIYTYFGGFQNFYYNSIHLTNTNSASRAFENYYGTNKNLLNNIFANSGGGYASYVNGGTGIAGSNFNDFYTTGATLGYWNGNTATNIATWKAITGKDLNSVSANPLFYSDTDLHILQVALDSSATTIPGIVQDFDGDARNSGFPDIGADEFDFLEDDIGVIAIINPIDDCDLSNAEKIKVVIQNYGGLPQTGFDIAFGLQGGGSQIQENVGGLIVQPGDTAHYIFSGTTNLESYFVYPFESFTLLSGDLNVNNDTVRKSIQNYQTPTAVSNMLPADGALDIDPPINFSWLPSAGAIRYDLYLWKQGDPVPIVPVGQDLTQITFAYNNNALIFGETYQWQVNAKNDFCETTGPIQSFTLRELPDLIVSSVQAPISPFSGQSIEVSWIVENQAIGNTGMATWYDYVYLSADNTYQSGVDTYLGGFPNLTALNSMTSYSQMKNVTLPQGIQGTFYIFIVTDRNNSLIEGNNENNVSSGASMAVTLTPPPDLIVSSIITPNQAFSGTTINVNWTVLNQGTGDDPGGTHTDRIYISTESSYNPANAIFLAQAAGSALDAGNSYNNSTSVLIPQSIFGDYHIHVVTDFYNNVFEHVFEDNNDETSDTINIILTPPPDLVVSSISTPSSANNKESVNIQWKDMNQGATTATDNFYDRLYISSSDTYHPDSVTNLTAFFNTTDITPGDSISRQGTISIPNNVSDTQYIYITTDINNNVFEYLNEDNNTRRSNPLIVNSADLIVSSVVVPDSTSSGDDITVQWTIENQGSGDVLNFNRKDQIFISTDPVYDQMTATNLGSLTYNGVLPSGLNTIKQHSVPLPEGISGTYYIHIISDVNNSVFEIDENNNINSDSSIIQLSPWPDLRVDTLLNMPDTTTAGVLLELEYIVQNYGTAAVQGSGEWQDRVYISPNPVWNPADAVTLKTLDILQPVGIGDTYTGNTQFILPMLGGAATSGVCFIYVLTDINDKVFEFTDENNNVKRSNPIFVSAPPPVDFSIINVTSLPDTVSTGDEVNLQWSIQNFGSTTGLWGYPLWYDGVYLSEDTIWSEYDDLFVKDFTKQGPVDSLEIYNDNQMFYIPQGISGDYYAFLVADHKDVTNDDTDSNNIRLIRPASKPIGPAQPIHVTLTPSPDLSVSTMIAPSSTDAGQPIQVIWTVENSGAGSTSGTWTDKIYLSTDFAIDNSDVIIGSKNQTRSIGTDSAYTDTVNAFIPINAVGNFVVILKTDANNALFELNGENNNTFFNFLTTSLPLPSDLVVNSLLFDTMAMVGESFPVTYDLYNQGVNPASGFMQDLIYLSQDSVFDPSDVKHIGPVSRNINLAPASGMTFSPSKITPGVPLGDYYVIVQTDILNNIFENSDTNNITISTQKVKVSIQELPLGVLTPDTMFNNTGIYYRIEIPDTLDGETMLVTLDGPVDGINELYLSYGTVPTRSVHDFTFSNPFDPDQEIIVPEIQEGTYYVFAYGVHAGDEKQFVDLKAEIIPFQIRSVEAARGGNTGNVTLKIEGAKFTPDMELTLYDPVLDSITAHKLTYINSTQVFATYNLAGAEIGIYDVLGTKTNEFANFPDGFEIVEGAAGSTIGGEGGENGFFCNIVNVGTQDNLSKNIQHPPRIRVNRLVPITIQFGNGGNVDIPCPFRWLLSMRGAPLSFDPDDFSENKQELYLEFREPGGPPGIIRPGAIATITVYSFSSSPLRFVLRE